MRELANSAASIFVFGLPNSVDAAIDERGWTELPFGMWAHSKGFQRFGQKEAESIVDAFRSVCGKLKRALVGAPVFRGHPDNPELANQYPDKTEYGQVCDMEVSDTGLRIKHVLSNAGSSLVTKLGLDRISPNWLVSDTGETKEGRPVYAPFAIKSVGLVKKPNIPNLSLYNEAETHPMKDKLLAILALANTATDDEIVAAVTAFSKRPKPEELDTAKNNLVIANARVESLETQVASEKKRADDGAKALANERTVAVKGELDTAIRTGRIAAADRPTWEKIMANDFEAGRKVLAAVPAKIKVKERARTEDLAEADRIAREAFANGDDGADLGADGNEMSNRAAKITGLVNKEMAGMGDDCGLKGNAKRNRAWSNVKKNFPKLFEPLASGTGDATV